MLNKKHRNLFPFLLSFFTLAAGIASCGLEEYYYLPSIPENSILEVELNNKATIHLPDIDTSPSGFYYFKNFAIFYRVYVSGMNNSGKIQDSSESLRNINYSLASDYSAIYPSTNITDSTSNTSVGSLFQGRRYYQLALEGANIESVLGNSAINRTFVLYFPPNPGEKPSLTIGGTTFTLFRSNGEGSFEPVPDRYFLASTELTAGANATTAKNADVADNTSVAAAMPRYAYISLYLVVVGLDNKNLTPIYSKPTFIGILRLPESS